MRVYLINWKHLHGHYDAMNAHSVEFNSSSQEISFNYHPFRISVEKLNSHLKRKVGIVVSDIP